MTFALLLSWGVGCSALFPDDDSTVASAVTAEDGAASLVDGAPSDAADDSGAESSFSDDAGSDTAFDASKQDTSSNDTALPDACVADAGAADAGVADAAPQDSGAKDGADSDGAAGDSANGPAWLTAVHGTWVIGWAGGLNHFSWVRFGDTGVGSGVAWFNAGDKLAINAPMWSCTGEGTWMMTAKPQTVALNFPKACKLPLTVLTFETFQPVTNPDAWPKGSSLTATITLLSPAGGIQQLTGSKFPDTVCNATLSTCDDVFK